MTTFGVTFWVTFEGYMAKTPDSRRPELAGVKIGGPKRGPNMTQKGVIFDPFLGPLFWGPSGAGLRESGVLAIYHSKRVIFWDPILGHI